ncbi:hypothetical protein, partial [Paraburkholderia sp. RL17-373-BIF-A]|uniref:hypothetical protein n=1 Tax=Paraburkholderia sp. RL17-373-BIF-A TaxID=3031629 RepID=UPI0038BA0986
MLLGYLFGRIVIGASRSALVASGAPDWPFVNGVFRPTDARRARTLLNKADRGRREGRSVQENFVSQASIKRIYEISGRLAMARWLG